MQLTQMAIYRFGLAFAALTFVDFTGVLAESEFSTSIKYSYTLIILLFIATFVLRWRRIDCQSAAPLLALLFFVVTTAILFTNIFFYGVNLSYASAFTASLIFAAAAFISRNSVIIDADQVINHIIILFMFGVICYLLNAMLKYGNYLVEDIQHVESIICLLALCLAILAGQKIVAVVVVLMTAVALVLRPTSTLVLALIICLPLAFALRFHAIRLSRLFTNIIVAVVILGPLAFYFFFDEIAGWTTAIDNAIKDSLGSHSNAPVRLAILSEAFRSLDESSFWFGNGLSGDTTVSIVTRFPYWYDVNRGGLATIHSDFVIVLTQSGIIGYGIFAFFIFSMFNIRFRQLAASNANNTSTNILLSISIIGSVAMLIFSSFNPFLQQYQFAHPIWMLIFISEVVINRDRLDVVEPLAEVPQPIEGYDQPLQMQATYL